MNGKASVLRARGRKPNPILDILETSPFADLATALRAHIETIIHRWEQYVREVLPAADKLTLTQVRDHLPQTLAKLAGALESATSEETRELIGQTGVHGAERFHQGYNVEELLVEYRLLRRVVIEQVEAELGRRTTTSEDLALSMGIDTVLHQGVIAFVQHQNQRLESANRAEAKYLSFLSHDLRSQLNGISLTMELIKRRLVDEPGFAQEVDDIEALQGSLGATVEGMQRLLQAERLRLGAAGPKCGPVNLRVLATEVAREFIHQANAKGLNLVVEAPPDLVIQSDREWLQIILQNLLSNAVKYSSAGTIRVRAGEPCSLSVSDQGPGIPPELVNDIFEAFQRGQTHGQPGIGLGLAIASQAARLLGADLTVQSEVGAGSTFCLSLPQRPD